MDTTRATELLEHFKMHGISHNPKEGLNYVLEYQDVIGHAHQGDIKAYWDTLDGIQQSSFLWANFLTLSQDAALHMVASGLFDTVLFPLNYVMFEYGFGPALLDAANERGMGILALALCAAAPGANP